MEELVLVKDLMFPTNKKPLLSNVSFSIREGDFIGLVGPNGCGKSTLIKLLVGLLPSKDCIWFQGKAVTEDNLMELRQKIGVVFEHADTHFVGQTVIDDLAFTLENMALPKDEIRALMDEIYTLFHIEHLLDCNPHQLSGGEKQKVALASVLVMKPKLLVLDEALSMVDVYEKEAIFKILKQYQKKGMAILMVSHNPKELLHTKTLLGITKKGLIQKDTLCAFEDESFVKEMSLELPFMVDLSLKLKLYELVDHVILEKKEMVVALWK